MTTCGAEIRAPVTSIVKQCSQDSIRQITTTCYLFLPVFRKLTSFLPNFSISPQCVFIIAGDDRSTVDDVVINAMLFLFFLKQDDTLTHYLAKSQ